MQGQPPGPGFPIHEPSVMSWIFFIVRSGSRVKLLLEEGIYLTQNLRGFGGLVDFDTQLRPVADAVREVSRKLFHLADDVGRAAIAQHRVVGPHDLIALPLGRVIVTSSLEIL